MTEKQLSKQDIEDMIYECFKGYKSMRGLTRSEELLIADFGDYIIMNGESHYKKIIRRKVK